MNKRWWIVVVLLGVSVDSRAFAARAVRPTPTPASYTVSQAYQGRFAFIENCAECHAGNLAGNFGPALAGPHSNIPWQTPQQVYSYMTEQMPVGNAGGLSQREYIDIEAFILESNGRRAGAKALTLDAFARQPGETYLTAQIPVFSSLGFAPGTGPILILAKFGVSFSGNAVVPAG